MLQLLAPALSLVAKSTVAGDDKSPSLVTVTLMLMLASDPE